MKVPVVRQQQRRFRKFCSTKSIAALSFAGFFLQERLLAFQISPVPSYSVSTSNRFFRRRIGLTGATGSDDSTQTSFEDFGYWERMYEQGKSLTTTLDRPDDNLLVSNPVQPCEIRVVTFDLDNTLWKTGPTIAAANDVLAQFLDRNGIVVPVRVERVMNELFRANPTQYAPFDTSKPPQAPVLLTNLRKDAIRSVLETYNAYSPDAAEAVVDEAFRVWTEARHDFITQHLAVSAATCLQQIRKLATSSQENSIVIGAITDGNSDPRAVQSLRHYFDFCVNAEQVGVAKPDKRMYLEAMRQLSSQSFLKDFLGSVQLAGSHMSPEEDDLENVMGPWWVHVGDDFVKDVVAAKSLKLRTIWSRELTQSRPEPSSSKQHAKSSFEATQRKSVEDFVKQVSEMKVIEMSVGADDYLADSISSEFADAVVDNFMDVSKVLHQWQSEALPSKAEQSTKEALSSHNGSVVPETTDALLEAISPSRQPSLSSTTQAKVLKSVEGNDKVETKFCMYCGNQLPIAAKFCFACGEKQPEFS